MILMRKSFLRNIRGNPGVSAEGKEKEISNLPRVCANLTGILHASVRSPAFQTSWTTGW